MSAAAELHCTIEEYLAREQVAPHKSQYYRGQIFAMSDGTPRHNTTGGNIFASLRGTRCRSSSPLNTLKS